MAESSTRLRLRVSPGARRSELVGLSIVSGHSAREKIVRLDGIDPAESERRLEGAQA